jgi:hypothetical protein
LKGGPDGLCLTVKKLSKNDNKIIDKR